MLSSFTDLCHRPSDCQSRLAMSGRRASYQSDFRRTENLGSNLPRAAPSTSVPQQDPYKELAYSVPANYWTSYAPSNAGPSRTYRDSYSSAASPLWAYGGGRYYRHSLRAPHAVMCDGTRKHRARDYAECEDDRACKRQLYVPKASVKRKMA